MCAECVSAVREIFPEVPDEEMGNFLYGATGFPFVPPEKVKEQLASARLRMASTDWREAYGIADSDLDREMTAMQEVTTPPPPPPEP